MHARAPESADKAVDVLVLGAGLTGLSAAYHLTDKRVAVLEARREVGGHARSHRRDGHTFDITGHWLHLRDPEMAATVRALDPELRWTKIARLTEIYCAGQHIPYPFQANLHALPLAQRRWCLREFVRSRMSEMRGSVGVESSRVGPGDFGQFVRSQFGRGMEELFFRPYNERLWDCELETLTCDWMSRFLPRLDVDEILDGALGASSSDIGYNATFEYPDPGGIDHLPRAFSCAITSHPGKQIVCSQHVERIDVASRRVFVHGKPDGWKYETLISSLPLPRLIQCIESAPGDVKNAASRLVSVPWRYLDIGLHHAPPRAAHWIYVPEPDSPFFRVGCYSNACPKTAPPGGGSLYVELADRKAPLDLPRVVDWLIRVGMLGSPNDIKFVDERRIEHAYVRFDRHYADARKTVLDWLEKIGIQSCGRYGSWIYNSMEDSLIEGRDAALRATKELCG